jgi:peptide/nickel transport system substrate-binding protein
MKKLVVLTVFIMLLFSVAAFGARFDRKETMYITGGLWGPPSNFNPLAPWSAHPGVIGGIYETLYFYDPITDSLSPWLAESGGWTDDDTYKLVLRDNLTWSDGTPLTSEDVVYTFALPGSVDGIHYVSLYEKFESVEAVDEKTIIFDFSDPVYQEWGYQLYQIPILPKHAWENKTPEEMTLGANIDTCMGSGEYMLEDTAQDRIIYIRNDNWWGNEVFGQPKPKRIVCLGVPSNNVILGMMMKGEELDFANSFLPGIPAIKNAYGIHTFYDGEPYMLSANTAFVYINTTRPGLDDPKVRRGMAFAIDPIRIVERVFENMVLPSNTLGFLPIDGWMKYYNEDIANEKGFYYDPEMAKKLFEEAGMKDVNGDGFLELADGSEFKIEIICPYGWTDWMESERIIAEDLRAVGINCEPKFPEYNKYFDDITSGAFDLAVNNTNTKGTSTPWTLYYQIYQDLIDGRANNGNYCRVEDPVINELIDEFNRVPLDDEGKAMEAVSKIEEKFLDTLPAIPLWYNGMWFEANTQIWTNWPSADSDNNLYYPSGWAGEWQQGFLKILINVDLK